MTDPLPDAAHQLNRFRAYLGRKAHVVTQAVTAAPHEGKAALSAKGVTLRQTVIGTPEYRKMNRRLVATLQGLRRPAPAPGGELAADTLAGLRDGGIELRRPDAPGNRNMVERELVAEYQRAKGAAMSRLGRGDDQLDWLTVLMQMDTAAVQVADFLAAQAADPDNEWLRQLTGGQLIQEDGARFRSIAQRVSGLLGGRVFDLKATIFHEAVFAYDPALTGAANTEALQAVTGRLDELVELAERLRQPYEDYGDLIKELGDHVGRLVDEEGWKTYALGHLKYNVADALITGVSTVLGLLAAAVRELPYHGAGAAGATVNLVIGRVTLAAHKAVRDVRIHLLKDRLAEESGTRDPAVLREAYLTAMEADKSLMAQRVLQIQKENCEAVWAVIAIPLAEIPVPLVAVAIKTFCLSLTVGYYEARVVNLRERLAPVRPGMVEQVVGFVREIFVEPAQEAIADAVEKQLLEQLSELGSRVLAAAGERADAVLDFLKEKFSDVAVIAQDVLEEVVVSFVAAVVAKLAARLIAKLGSDSIAPAISGGDLREILDRMDGAKAEVDQALAAL